FLLESSNSMKQFRARIGLEFRQWKPKIIISSSYWWYIRGRLSRYLDTYLENLKGELSFVKAENAKLSDEVENLMKMLNLEYSIRLQSNLEGLSSSLEFIQSQSQEVDLETKKADARLECSSMVEHQPDSDGAHGGCKFKIFYNCCNTDTSYKAASKLRLSIKYEDGDEMIVAHMVDEVDAFNKEGSNTTLRNHITHPHCEAIKAQQNQNPEAGQTSMARDRSVFRHDPDYLREQFAGLMIQ
ncbi:hypothetical protein Tco_0295093, partial [Tanacetum coccineum]